MTFRYPQISSKWWMETSRNLENEILRLKRSTSPKSQKLKSNESHNTYCSFERLGHQKHIFTTATTPNKKQSLQSKHMFRHFKSHKIRTHDPKMVTMGHPKVIDQSQKSVLRHGKALLSATLHQMITKLVPKWCPKTSEWPQNGVSRPMQINKLEC